MEPDFFDSFYKDHYEKMTKRFEHRSNVYRNATRLHQVALLTSSAITPVIIALSDSDKLKILAIALSSLVAILSGVGRIFRPEDAWMNSRGTRNALWREGICFQAGLSEYADAADRRALFVEQVTLIVDRYNMSQAVRIQESVKDPVHQIRKATAHNP